MTRLNPNKSFPAKAAAKVVTQATRASATKSRAGRYPKPLTRAAARAAAELAANAPPERITRADAKEAIAAFLARAATRAKCPEPCFQGDRFGSVSQRDWNAFLFGTSSAARPAHAKAT